MERVQGAEHPDHCLETSAFSTRLFTPERIREVGWMRRRRTKAVRAKQGVGGSWRGLGLVLTVAGSQRSACDEGGHIGAHRGQTHREGTSGPDTITGSCTDPIPFPRAGLRMIQQTAHAVPAAAEALRGLGRSGIDHPENFRSSNSERTSQQVDPMTIDVDVDESMAYGLVRLIYVRHI